MIKILILMIVSILAACTSAKDCADMCKPRGVLILDANRNCICNPMETTTMQDGGR